MVAFHLLVCMDAIHVHAQVAVYGPASLRDQKRRLEQRILPAVTRSYSAMPSSQCVGDSTNFLSSNFCSMILMSMDIIVCRFVLPYCTISGRRASNSLSFVVDMVTVYAGLLVSDMSKLNKTVPK